MPLSSFGIREQHVTLSRYSCSLFSTIMSQPDASVTETSSGLSHADRKREYAKNNGGMIHSNVLRLEDGCTEEGALYRTQQAHDIFSLFTGVLSGKDINPVIAWGDFSLLYYGVPTGISVSCPTFLPVVRISKRH